MSNIPPTPPPPPTGPSGPPQDPNQGYQPPGPPQGPPPSQAGPTGQAYGHPGSPAKPANWAGLTSLILGVVAFLGCWIPLVNIFSMILAGVGLALGIVGLVFVSKGKATNKVMAIVGLILSILTLVIAMIVSAVVGAAVSEVAKDAEKKISALPTSIMETETANTGKVGDALTVKGIFPNQKVEATLKEFKDPVKGAQNDTARDGYRLVGAHFVIKNTGTENYQDLSFVIAKVFGADGQGFGITLRDAEVPSLTVPMELKPGGSADGWLIFEVPAASKSTSVKVGSSEWKVG